MKAVMHWYQKQKNDRMRIANGKQNKQKDDDVKCKNENRSLFCGYGKRVTRMYHGRTGSCEVSKINKLLECLGYKDL